MICLIILVDNDKEYKTETLRLGFCCVQIPQGTKEWHRKGGEGDYSNVNELYVSIDTIEVIDNQTARMSKSDRPDKSWSSAGIRNRGGIK